MTSKNKDVEVDEEVDEAPATATVEPPDLSGVDPQQLVMSKDPDLQEAQDALIESTRTGQAQEMDPATGEWTDVDQPTNDSALAPEA